MSDLRTAAQQALEVEADRRRKALAAEMRAALAQQEPVAVALHTGTKQGIKWHREVEHGTPLYTAPPQRKPLSEEEIDAEWRKAASEEGFTTVQFVRNFARAVERAHGIVSE